jgi:hypothetical protein
MLAMIAGLHTPRRKPQVNAMDQVFGTYTHFLASMPFTRSVLDDLPRRVDETARLAEAA